ncbi:shikimate dehydrogenase1 [Zea mays]|uniref:Shikimate dehydrogenase1 n=1 Tax=Zea mays TaxID=4577 RepID=C0HI34_MAIZE|nr:unknown [Zea mays]AQK40335.1 shikimate dehydrogenase1 [Zea mays]
MKLSDLWVSTLCMCHFWWMTWLNFLIHTLHQTLLASVAQFHTKKLLLGAVTRSIPLPGTLELLTQLLEDLMESLLAIILTMLVLYLLLRME